MDSFQQYREYKYKYLQLTGQMGPQHGGAMVFPQPGVDYRKKAHKYMKKCQQVQMGGGKGFVQQGREKLAQMQAQRQAQQAQKQAQKAQKQAEKKRQRELQQQQFNAQAAAQLRALQSQTPEQKLAAQNRMMYGK